MKTATASGNNLKISTKQTVEIGKSISGKKFTGAMQMLNEVMEKKRAVAFRRFKKDTGHKRGIAAGRYPINAAREVYAVLNNALANALSNDMDADRLYIKTFMANRAISKEQSSNRRLGKLTHLKVEVAEKEEEKKEAGNDRKKADRQ